MTDSKENGGPESLDPSVRIGETIADRYRIDALLGEGAMGCVYAAEHVLMRKRVAVKILHRRLTSVPEVIARFEREAMAAANIDHENVASATDFGKLPDGSVFLVLEYVEGRSLRDEVAQGRFDAGRALHVARQTASALAAAHALDIVHRDLKPENILLLEKAGDTSFVKILDFGIARVPLPDRAAGSGGGVPLTRVGLVVGTPEYMAPEQALGQKVDVRADLYALGVILYEMLAGVRPFDSASATDILGRQLAGPPPLFADRVPLLVVPQEIERITTKLLAKSRDERFASAEAVVSAIDAAIAGEHLRTLTLGSPASVGRPAAEPQPAADWRPTAEPAQPPPRVESTLLGVGDTRPAPEAATSVETGPSFVDGPFGAGVDRVVAILRGSYRDFDARCRALPAPLGRVLAPALLGGGALLVILAVIITGAVASRGGAPSPSSAVSAGAAREAVSAPAVTPATSAAGRSSRSPPDELARASKEGIDSLRRLASRYPTDSLPYVEMAKIHRGKKRYSEAVAAIAQALEVDPAAKSHPELATTLWTTVQSRAAREASFDLLEGPMGAKGADVLYDLATQEGVRPSVARRAESWLGSKQFDKSSSPALHVLVSLRRARTCRQRHALLLRAKNAGGWRTLDYLKSLRSRVGCGRHGDEDCHPCLRSDGRLEEVIRAMESKQRKPE